MTVVPIQDDPDSPVQRLMTSLTPRPPNRFDVGLNRRFANNPERKADITRTCCDVRF
jgi:hypothetical protein